MDSLKGKVALITGAKGGLGTFVTNAFLTDGALVAGVSRSIKDADFPSDRFAAFEAELTSAEAVQSAVDRAFAKYERVDVLVHLAGAFAGGKPVADTSDDVFEQMIDANLRSAFLMCRAVLPIMRAQGAGNIVAIGSRAAAEGNAGAGVYSASKAGLIALMRAVALENKDRSVSANVILPATIDTPANRSAMPGADTTKWVDPAQLAALILFVASRSVSQMSGAVLPIYGGDL